MTERQQKPQFPWWKSAATGFVVGLVALGAGGWWRYGTWQVAAHAWRGDAVLADRYEVALDRPQDAQTVAFRLTNTSSHPIRVLGAKSSCTCVMATGLPLDFAPGASRTLEVRVKPKKLTAGSRESVQIYLDHAGQRSIPLTISAPSLRETKG